MLTMVRILWLGNFNTKLGQVVKLGGNAAIPLYDVTACAYRELSLDHVDRWVVYL